MALGRNHVLVIVAIAGIMALTLAGAGLFSGKPGARLCPDQRLRQERRLAGIQGASLRAAASAEGLKTAEPVPLRALNFQTSQSGEFTLPIPADQLPAGISAVKGSFTRTRNSVSGQLGICRTDAQKIVWQCDVGVCRGPAIARTRRRPSRCPAWRSLR